MVKGYRVGLLANLFPIVGIAFLGFWGWGSNASAQATYSVSADFYGDVYDSGYQNGTVPVATNIVSDISNSTVPTNIYVYGELVGSLLSGGLGAIDGGGYATASAGHLTLNAGVAGQCTYAASVSGQADAGASWSDTITITSDTLPIGTPVSLELTMVGQVDASAFIGGLFNINGGPEWSASMRWEDDSQAINNTTTVGGQLDGFPIGSASFYKTVVYTPNVGDTVYILGSLQGDAYMEVYGDFSPPFGFFSATITIRDVPPSSNPNLYVQYFIDPITPGVSYISSSGQTNCYPTVGSVLASLLPPPSDLAITPVKPDVALSFTGFSNLLYSVQSCTDPASGNWITLTNNIEGTNGMANFTDPGGATNSPSRFYRVGVQMPVY